MSRRLILKRASASQAASGPLFWGHAAQQIAAGYCPNSEGFVLI